MDQEVSFEFFRAKVYIYFCINFKMALRIEDFFFLMLKLVLKEQVFLGVMTSKNLHIRRSTRKICKNEQNLSLAKIIRSPFYHDRWAKFLIEKKDQRLLLPVFFYFWIEIRSNFMHDHRA